MAIITFDFSPGQTARGVAAKDWYNAKNGTNLTTKDYLLVLIKAGLRAQARQAVADSEAASYQTAVAAELAAVEADLAGSA